MMKRIICFLIFCCLSVALCNAVFAASNRIYKLKEIIKNSDFDYKWLKNIDQVPPPFPENSPYQIGDIKTKKGRFTIYKFICLYPAVEHETNKTREFHDLLVLKINKTKKIIDAYHYTLDWQDSPSLALYKANSKNIALKNNLPLSTLKLKSITDNKNIPQNGVILLK